MTFVVQLAQRAVALCFFAAVAAAALPAYAQVDEHHVIVTYKKGKAAKFRALGKGPDKLARIKHDLPRIDALAMVVSGAELKKLRHDGDVAFIEDDVRRYPLAATAASTGAIYQKGQLVPYGLKMVQADQLPDTKAGNRTVCIIDSGYDRSHEDLPNGSNITGEYDAGTGWWYTDEDHHGTHVAGILVALNNGTGTVGIAPGGRLRVHIVKVFNAKGWAYSSTLAAAAEKCADHGAHIISMSLGGAKASKTEQATFDALEKRGILSVAASGNDGNHEISYPAGYDSVLMVGAVNEAGQYATYSQYNSKVELVAPGSQIFSTVPMGAGFAPALEMAGDVFAPGTMDGTPLMAVSAPLADFGTGDSAAATMAGKLCLITRGGGKSFADKVLNCQASGGVGAIIANNMYGAFAGSLDDVVTNIPSATVSQAEGARLRARLGSVAQLTVRPLNYMTIDGTSMAVPHVSGVAALVWSYFPSCTGLQIRTALRKSALDVSGAGRSERTGYGLVQARAAYENILKAPCGRSR